MDIEKATPVQMRKSLELADYLKRVGVRFVPIPSTSEEDYQNLLKHLCSKLGKLIKEVEGHQTKSTTE